MGLNAEIWVLWLLTALSFFIVGLSALELNRDSAP